MQHYNYGYSLSCKSRLIIVFLNLYVHCLLLQHVCAVSHVMIIHIPPMNLSVCLANAFSSYCVWQYSYCVLLMLSV